jgi:excisionase family DNA binding protein
MIETDLTTDDVAAALRLNRATVQRLLNAGRLRGSRIGRAWRVPPSALEAFRKQAEPIEQATNHAVVLISVIDDYERWVKALFSEEGLVSAPALPLEAMSRESIYEDR